MTPVTIATQLSPSTTAAAGRLAAGLEGLARIGAQVHLRVRSRLVPVPPRLLLSAASLLGGSERMRRLCESLQVDVRPTLDVLDWRPRTSLEDGLAATAEYFDRETRG